MATNLDSPPAGAGELNPNRSAAEGNQIAELRAELREARAQIELLEHDNRAKADFLAHVSHEIRTPLNAILGYAELLLDGVPEALPASGREHVERIRASAWHQLRLVNELIRFAKLQSGSAIPVLERIDVAALVADVAAMVAPAIARKGLELEVEIAQPALQLRSDPMRVRQILINILWNAVKFTSNGVIELRVAFEKHHARFLVKDTGPGIAPEHLARIFDPFWQADSRSSLDDGVGLGLTLTRNLADSIGAELRVESE